VAIAAATAGSLYLAQGGGVEAHGDGDGRRSWSVTVASASGGAESFYAPTAPLVTPDALVLASTVSRLVALNLRDGQVMWREPAAAEGAVQWLGTREAVLLSLGYGDLSAHDLSTGRPLFTHAFARRVEAMPALLGSMAFAAPTSGLCHVLDGDELVALDLRAGTIRWRAATRGAARFTGNGRTLLLVDGERRRGLDATSGETRWEAPSEGAALVAPLTAEVALLQSERATSTIDYASGRIESQQINPLRPGDEVLDARDGRAILALGDDTRLFFWREGRLFQAEIGQHPGIARLLDRTRADARTLQALIYERWVAVYSKDHTIELFTG
jgi:hypothetical protein